MSLLRRRGSGGLADIAGDAGMDLAGVLPGLDPGCTPGCCPPAAGSDGRCCGRGQDTAVGVLGPVDPRGFEGSRRGSGALAARRSGDSRPSCERTACAGDPAG